MKSSVEDLFKAFEGNKTKVSNWLRELVDDIENDSLSHEQKELLNLANKKLKEIGLKELSNIENNQSDFYHVLSSVKFCAENPDIVKEMIISHAFEADGIHNDPEKDTLKVSFLVDALTDQKAKEENPDMPTIMIYGLIEGHSALVGKNEKEEFDLNAPIPFVEAYKTAVENEYYLKRIEESSKDRDSWKKYDSKTRQWAPMTVGDALESKGYSRDLLGSKLQDKELTGSITGFGAGSDFMREMSGEVGANQKYAFQALDLEMLKRGIFVESFVGQGGGVGRKNPNHVLRKTDQGDVLPHLTPHTQAMRSEEDCAHNVMRAQMSQEYDREERTQKLVTYVLGEDAVENAKDNGLFKDYVKGEVEEATEEISREKFIKLVAADLRVRVNTGNLFKMPNLRIDNPYDHAVREDIRETDYEASKYYMQNNEYDGKAGKFSEFRNAYYTNATGIHIYKKNHVANRPGSIVEAGKGQGEGIDDYVADKYLSEIDRYIKDIKLMKTRAIGTYNAEFMTGNNSASVGYDGFVARLGLRDPMSYELKEDFDPKKRIESLDRLLMHTVLEPEKMDRMIDLNFSIATSNKHTAWKFANAKLNNDGTIIDFDSGNKYEIEELAKLIQKDKDERKIGDNQIPEHLIWAAHTHVEFKIASLAAYEMNMNLQGKVINENQREAFWNLLESNVDKAMDKFRESMPKEMKEQISQSLGGIQDKLGYRYAQEQLADLHQQARKTDSKLESVQEQLEEHKKLEKAAKEEGEKAPELSVQVTKKILDETITETLTGNQIKEYIEEMNQKLEEIEEESYPHFHVAIQQNESVPRSVRNPNVEQKKGMAA